MHSRHCYDIAASTDYYSHNIIIHVFINYENIAVGPISLELAKIDNTSETPWWYFKIPKATFLPA